jgi:hypothetical protein
MRNSISAIGRYIGVSHRHLTLHFDCTPDSIDDTGELEQQAVAGSFDDATPMFLDLGIRQLAPKRLQPRKRSLLVDTHQARVTCHSGGKNGGQPAFDESCGQSGAPQPHGPNSLSALEAHSNGKSEGGHYLSVERHTPVSA